MPSPHTAPLALLGATLSLTPGCLCSAPSSRPPGPGAPASAPPASATPPAEPSPDAWRRARVGDGVTYAFSLQSRARPGGEERSLRGRVALDVVAVRQPWIWVRLAIANEAGQPLDHLRLGRELTLPISTRGSRQRELPADVRPERFPAAGRTWEALRGEKDQRPVDGPKTVRVYAVDPAPLYLTHGLLDAGLEFLHRDGSGAFQFTLHAVREGKAGEPGTPPALERPLGPGTYYDQRMDHGAESEVRRVCLSAERGFLLRTEGPLEPNAPPCAEFTPAPGAPPEEHLPGSPLEEAVMQLVQGALVPERWPPAVGGPPTPSTFQVEDRQVPALTMELAPPGMPEAMSWTVAVDPWAPELSGLALEARFQPLVQGTERRKPNGQRVPQDTTRLVRWGTWLDGMK